MKGTASTINFVSYWGIGINCFIQGSISLPIIMPEVFHSTNVYLSCHMLSLKKFLLRDHINTTTELPSFSSVSYATATLQVWRSHILTREGRDDLLEIKKQVPFPNGIWLLF